MILENMDYKTMAYIRSEAEFDRARRKGFWDMLLSLVSGAGLHLLSLDEAVARLHPTSPSYQGVRDIPLKQIVGSAGRPRDFTRHFLPCLGDMQNKERWRIIYTLVVTGQGFPPIEVYQLGQDYFVENGHHRVSVASYLGWETIQARVMELPIPAPDRPGLNNQPGCLKGAV